MSTEKNQHTKSKLLRLIIALEQIGIRPYGRNKAIAAKTGLSTSHLSEIFSSKVELTDKIMWRICTDFGISENWINTGEGQMLIAAMPPDAKPVRNIPVLGTVPAGFPEYVAEEVIGWVSRSDAPENAYALQIKGDSMLPLEAGDYIVFIQNGDYQNSDIVVAHNEWGEFMVKRLRIRPDGSHLLTSDNPKYSPIEPNEHYRIVGKVIKAWRELI